MRDINQIIIHHSGTLFGCYEEIREWHVVGNKWDDIGYHYVIPNGRPHQTDKYRAVWDGHLETGRRLDIQGAHVKGHNAESIGICLVGKGGRFTPRQLTTLRGLVKSLQVAFAIPDSLVFGHRTWAKTQCPGFNVPEWVRHGGLGT